MNDDSVENQQQNQEKEQTVEVVVTSTGHRTYKVPLSDVDHSSVSLENAELSEERVHGDPISTKRRDTEEEVEIRE